MVHRDVKPQNVLIDLTGRAKLTDFGIARELNDEGVTATGRVIGTTDYVAPSRRWARKWTLAPTFTHSASCSTRC